MDPVTRVDDRTVRRHGRDAEHRHVTAMSRPKYGVGWSLGRRAIGPKLEGAPDLVERFEAGEASAELGARMTLRTRGLVHRRRHVDATLRLKLTFEFTRERLSDSSGKISVALAMIDFRMELFSSTTEPLDRDRSVTGAG